jgi:hypothetical protein
MEQDRIGLLVGWTLGIIGLWFFDYFLYPTIDYFGKLVFSVAINIFWVWLVWIGWKLTEGRWKLVTPMIIGLIELGAGLYIYYS